MTPQYQYGSARQYSATPQYGVLPAQSFQTHDSVGAGYHSFDSLGPELWSRASHIQLLSRFHQAQQCLEQDYQLTTQVLGRTEGGRTQVRLGMSSEKRDESVSQPRMVAVKTLNLRDATQERREEFVSEAAVLLCLDHPHVLRIFDVYVAVWQLHIVSEYLRGGVVYTWVLVDFGLSAFCSKDRVMTTRKGTVEHGAPEVVAVQCTQQCGLWRVGVVSYIVLSGSMPWSSRDPDAVRKIQVGGYLMDVESWGHVSEVARDFVQGLLRVDPLQRLTAQAALAHPWLAAYCRVAGIDSVDQAVVRALRLFPVASRFRRCCMAMAAWSLSAEEVGAVTEHFLTLDVDRRGVIKAKELQCFLVDKFDAEGDEILKLVPASLSHASYAALMEHLPTGVTLSDVTWDYSLLMVTGPKTDGVLQPLMSVSDWEQVAALPNFSAADVNIAGQPTTVSRVSYCGGLGYELHVPNANGAAVALYDSLQGNSSVTEIGYTATNLMRTEAARPFFTVDIPMRARYLDCVPKFLAKLGDNQPDFVGKAAIKNGVGASKFQVHLAAEDPHFFMSCLNVAAPEVGGKHRILFDGHDVGYVTSGFYGFRAGRSVMFALLDTRSDLGLTGKKALTKAELGRLKVSDDSGVSGTVVSVV